MLEPEQKVMKLEIEIKLTWKMKTEPTPELTPLIEKWNQNWVPFFNKKGTRTQQEPSPGKWCKLEPAVPTRTGEAANTGPNAMEPNPSPRGELSKETTNTIWSMTVGSTWAVQTKQTN